MERDERIFARLKRRLESARGTVFLEFAMVAPLAMSLILFAYDFTTILYAEQQLDIASRAAADIESHMNHFGRDKNSADANGKPGPCSQTKIMVKGYLQKTLGLSNYKDIYIMGDAKPTPGASQIFEHIHRFLTGDIVSPKVPLNVVWKFLLKLLRGFLKIITLGTDVYLLDIPRGDLMVRMTCSAWVYTFLPRGMYSFWSAPKYVEEKYEGHPRVLLVPYRYRMSDEDAKAKFDWNSKPDLTERYRYYCVMPAHDTAPVAPNTFVRDVRSWFSKWVPESAWPKDDD